MVKKKTCIFISGQGSNLKNLINRSRDSNFPLKICLVISNNRDAKGINYAKKFGIPYIFINTKIKNIFLKNNLTVKDSKKIHITKDEAAEFYKVHQSKPFYNDLCSYLSSGPIVVMILEGENAILANRKLMGATNPKEAEENTIRKLYGISIDKNSVHGSDSEENAKKEINYFFKN